MKKLYLMMTALLVSVSLFAARVEIVPNASDAGVTPDGGTPSECTTTVNGYVLAWGGGYYPAATTPDFRVFAGQAFTVTAPAGVNIVSAKVLGMVKKGFSATASAGTLVYGTEVENTDKTQLTKNDESDPVLTVSNINANALTLNFVKQCRIYKLILEVGEGGGNTPDPQPTGDYEFNIPDGFTTATWNVEANLVVARNYGSDNGFQNDLDDITLMFADPENAEDTVYNIVQTDIFVPHYTGGGVDVIPAGVYPINESMALGTAMVGFTDANDNYLGSWLFDTDNYADLLTEGVVRISKDANNVYTVELMGAGNYTTSKLYLMCTMHFQGAINVDNSYNADEQQAVENVMNDQPRASKVMENGTLYILKDNVKYSVLGAQVK